MSDAGEPEPEPNESEIDAPDGEQGGGDMTTRRRASSVGSTSDPPFTRASPVRTIMSESPMAESYIARASSLSAAAADVVMLPANKGGSTSSVSSAGQTPTKTKGSTGPKFTVGSPDSPEGSNSAMEEAMIASRAAPVRTETTSSANTVTPALVANSPTASRSRPPLVDTQTQPQGLRRVEVVEISPIAASPEDVDENGLVGGLEKEQKDARATGQGAYEGQDDDDDDDDDDMDDDRDSGGADDEEGGTDADLEQTIGDEPDPDSDDSGESAPRTYQAKPFKHGAAGQLAKEVVAAVAAAQDDKKGPGSDKVGTSVSSTSSILSNRSNTGDGKVDSSKGLSRETSSGKVSFKEPPPNLRRTSSAAGTADALPPTANANITRTSAGPPSSSSSAASAQDIAPQPAKATASSLSSSFKRTEGFVVEAKAAATLRKEEMQKGPVVSSSPTGGLSLKLKSGIKGDLPTIQSRPSSVEATPPAGVLANPSPSSSSNAVSRVPSKVLEPILQAPSPKGAQSPAKGGASPARVVVGSPAKPIPGSPGRPQPKELEFKLASAAAPRAGSNAGSAAGSGGPSAATSAAPSPGRPNDVGLKSVLASKAAAGAQGPAASALTPGLAQAAAKPPSRSTTPEQGEIGRRPAVQPAKIDNRPLAESPHQPAFTPNAPAALGAGAYRLSPAGQEAVSVIRTTSPALSASGGSYQDLANLSTSAPHNPLMSSSPSTGLSRTQKKLLLQRQAVMASDNTPPSSLRTQNKLVKELEKVTKEYWTCTRRWADPLQDSMDRVLNAIREERIKAGLPVDLPEDLQSEYGGSQRGDVDETGSVSSVQTPQQSAASSSSTTPQPHSPIARPPGQTVERMEGRLPTAESTANLQNRRLQSVRDQGTMRRIQSAPGMASGGTRTRSSGLWNMLFGN